MRTIGSGWSHAARLLAGVGVAAGAIGTHFLKETLKLPPEKLQTFETAVRYQMYHALG